MQFFRLGLFKMARTTVKPKLDGLEKMTCVPRMDSVCSSWQRCVHVWTGKAFNGWKIGISATSVLENENEISHINNVCCTPDLGIYT